MFDCCVVDEMGTIYNVILKEKLLEGMSNFQVWRDVVQNVFEKEDFMDLLEFEVWDEHRSNKELNLINSTSIVLIKG